ncbi:hypothetical protein APV28_0393 [Comamonas testosteroni]|nr:hypothetical protein APV28_0393 [Comamonas testosteroni]
MGLNLAGSAAGCCFHRGYRRHASQLAAELVEILGLGRHDLACFLGRGGLGGCLIGQLDYRAAAHAVDVAIDKGLGVAAQHGDQHLIERDACGLVRCRNASGGVAGPDADFITAASRCCSASLAFSLRLGCSLVLIAVIAQVPAGRVDGAGRRACSHGGARRRRHHGRRGLGGSGCGLSSGRGRRGRAARGRGVEQQGVVALQLARCPVGIDHQVDKGIIDRLKAAELEHGRAIGAFLHLHAHRVGRACEFHALGAECRWRCDSGLQAVGLGSAELRDLDLGTQGLAQSRLHRDAAQCQCPCIGGREA